MILDQKTEQILKIINHYLRNFCGIYDTFSFYMNEQYDVLVEQYYNERKEILCEIKFFDKESRDCPFIINFVLLENNKVLMDSDISIPFELEEIFKNLLWNIL